MTLSFAAGFGCRFVDVYVLRTAPFGKTGVSFGILVMFVGLGRFLGTIIQPSLIQDALQVFAPLIMIGAMCLFSLVLWYIPSDMTFRPLNIFKKDALDNHIKMKLVSVL